MGGGTSAGARHSAAVEPSEEQFYSTYHWCLNPVLSLRELFRHLDEELDRLDHPQAGWQQREHQLNLYLFICAVACTVDDYLAFRLFDLSRIGSRFHRLRLAAASTERVLNLPRTLRALILDHRISRFRRDWNRCVNQVCRLLIREEFPTARSDSRVCRWTDLEK